MGNRLFSIPGIANGNRQGSQFLTSKRMSVSGTNILDGNGNKWCMRGFCYGESTLENTNDPAANAAMGCNCVRLNVHCWSGGTTGLPNVEAELPGAYGDTDPVQLASYVAMATAAKKAGLAVNLAFDSHCGCNGNLNSQFINGCVLFDGVTNQTGQNWGTPLGIAQKLPQQINRVRTFARILRGIVDFYELGVEMDWSATGGGQAQLNAYYVKLMNAVLAEDPQAIFIIGGQRYFQNNSSDPWNQGTVWPTGNIVGTCDMLDGVSSNPTNRATAISNAVAARTLSGFPFVVQQVLTNYNSEVGGVGSSTDSLLLSATLEALRTASGGSIGWTFWEMISAGPNNCGPWYDLTNNGSARQIASQNRINALQTAFAGVPVFA